MKNLETRKGEGKTGNEWKDNKHETKWGQMDDGRTRSISRLSSLVPPHTDVASARHLYSAQRHPVVSALQLLKATPPPHCVRGFPPPRGVSAPPREPQAFSFRLSSRGTPLEDFTQ